jgi:hypothetical protein
MREIIHRRINNLKTKFESIRLSNASHDTTEDTFSLALRQIFRDILKFARLCPLFILIGVVLR